MKAVENQTNTNRNVVTEYLHKAGIIRAIEEQFELETENQNAVTKEYKLDLQSDILLKAIEIFNSLKIKYDVTNISSDKTCSATLYYTEGLVGHFVMNHLLLQINELVKENLTNCFLQSFMDLMKGIEHKVKPIAD